MAENSLDAFEQFRRGPKGEYLCVTGVLEGTRDTKHQNLNRAKLQKNKPEQWSKIISCPVI